jgi:cell division protein FtsZ
MREFRTGETVELTAVHASYPPHLEVGSVGVIVAPTRVDGMCRYVVDFSYATAREVTQHIAIYPSDLDQRIEAVSPARIHVIGVGGGGSNAVRRMVDGSLEGVTFSVVNTDAQHLRTCGYADRVLIGEEVTRGRGAGSNPSVGERAAEDDIERLTALVTGCDLVFLTAGLGGGTGTGAGPVVARLAKRAGALVIAVITRPFGFEGVRRARVASEGIEKLREATDATLVIPNQTLLDRLDRSVPLSDAYLYADEVLANGVRGVAELVTCGGEVNLDFADLRSLLADAGTAMMGLGRASGADRARVAAKEAISCPFLESRSIQSARGVLVNVKAGSDFLLHELDDAMTVVRESVSRKAEMLFGHVLDERDDGEISVTVIATGFDHSQDDVGTEIVPRGKRLEPAVDPKRRYLDNALKNATGMVKDRRSFRALNVPAFLRRGTTR